MSEKSAAGDVPRFLGDRQARIILAAAEAGVTSLRREQVADLQRLLDWADLHSGDPQTQPNAVPASKGGPKLVQLGGEGTPEMADLAIGEVAIARGASWGATRNATADALDLRHRLPQFWAAVVELRVEVWVARKVVRLSRRLTRAQCQIVDAAVTAAADEGPARVLGIAEAKIIEADPDEQLRRLQEQAKRRGVWFSRRQPGDQVDETGEPGVRSVFARLFTGETVQVEELIEQLADLLEVHGHYDPDNPPTRDQLRADAFAMLADPAAVLALLEAPEPDEPSETPRPNRSPAILNVHLSAEVLSGDATGVARVENLGPMLLAQLATLLGHRHISLQPVIDLNDGRSVNGYEHPTDVKTRTEHRTVGDVFPHSSSPPGARVEHDHPVPYDTTGPPGQTGDHNDAPLTRRQHRAKTHLAYRVVQTGPGTYTWVTPHGLVRRVDNIGTHCVSRAEFSEGEYRAASGFHSRF